ncbi:MAG: amidohydrolase family protein [Pseudomonadota bacterium]
MIIDCHTHLLPRQVMADRTEFVQKDKAFGSLFSSTKAKIASQDEMLAYLDKTGIDKAIVFGFPWEDYELAAQNNDEIWDFHERYPNRILPFATFSILEPELAHKECSRTLSGGFFGLGELAMYRNGWGSTDFESLRTCLELAQHHRAPVMIHVNEPVGHDYPGKIFVDLKGLLRTIADFQQIDFILAHFGGGFFIYSLMPEIGRSMKRVYVDTAAAPFLYDSRIFSVAVQSLGEDKVLWGSDFPLLGFERYQMMLDQANVKGNLRAKILGGNVEEILNRRCEQKVDKQDLDEVGSVLA